MTEQDIRNAWAKMRATSALDSIPSEILDIMKDSAIAVLRKEKAQRECEHYFNESNVCIHCSSSIFTIHKY